MRAIRLSSRIALAALPLSLAACLTYPFLDEEGLPGAIDGVGSVTNPGSNSGSSGSGGGIGPANTNGDNQNTNAAPVLPSDETGDIAQELCDSFIVVSERDGSRVLNVYALTGEGSFADWSVGDDAGFDAETGILLNFVNSQHVTAQIVGEYGGNTLFLGRNEITQTVTLQNGSVWVYGPDDAEEVRQWRINSDLITEVTINATQAMIINRTRCTSIAGSSQ